MGKIILTQDGSHSMVSEQFGEAYHSKYGAIQESQHVFIEAGLEAVSEDLNNIHLLEMGMGTGLNVLLTYLANQTLKKTIYYTAIEAYPIKNWQELNYVELLDLDEKAQHFFEQLHVGAWEEMVQLSEHFYLKKTKTLLEKISLPKDHFHLIYFDAFAPNAQANLWTEDIFEKMYKSTALDGILTTYCAKGSVKRAMKAAGFGLEGLAGPPGKREMTRAIRK